MKFVSCRQSLSYLYLRLLVDGSDVGGTGRWRCELLVAVRARIRLQNENFNIGMSQLFHRSVCLLYLLSCVYDGVPCQILGGYKCCSTMSATDLLH